MSRLSRIAAGTALALGSILLSACGGGGGAGSSAAPSQQHPQSKGTPAPPAAQRTSVGTATLTLALPKALVGKKGQAIRGSAAAKSRHPAYVDPTSGNLLDIYVDGSLILNIDGVTPSHSLTVTTTADGTQTASVPLFAIQNNLIVAAEWDPTYTYLLAIGESNPTVYNGAQTNVTLTMSMNATGIGLVDFPNEGDPMLLQGGTYMYFICGGGTFGLYTADEQGTFVPQSGYGGTTTPSETATSDSGGSTTTVPNTQLPNLYQLAWDGSCDGVDVSATATNPAYAMVSDVSSNYDNYYYAYYYGYYGGIGGANQGIWNLIYGQYVQPLYNAFFGMSQTVSGSIDIQSGG